MAVKIIKESHGMTPWSSDGQVAFANLDVFICMYSFVSVSSQRGVCMPFSILEKHP